ncbi:MAG: hypothetical protein NC543_03190 [bacterium]|nr:hypothetical protein [bacterium]MCM1373939.1 hypothetical protein [Muribaculum sp.]
MRRLPCCNFKNFKSFRDEMSLDLTATKITEYVVEAANDKLLKVAAIYGANASGKSNVHDAFEYMAIMWMNPLFSGIKMNDAGKREMRM